MQLSDLQYPAARCLQQQTIKTENIQTIITENLEAKFVMEKNNRIISHIGRISIQETFPEHKEKCKINKLIN